MPERGHCYRLLGVVAALARRGAIVHVLTDALFRDDVERAGGRFVDLFARFPIEAVDATSRPIPCRYVSFAGFHATGLADAVAALDPALILYDTFAVVGPPIARRLGIPWVNVCAGHATSPERAVRALHDDPRVSISAECREAVRRLRAEHGMERASPFSYVDGLSPHLNLYCEPPQFLDGEHRAALEPLAFFGSLAPELHPCVAGPFRGGGGRGRVYVSFGTVVWRYFAAAAWPALVTLAGTLADLGFEVVVSMGGPGRDADERARVARTGVSVEDYVDQWAALAQADLFVTHQGLNSTHEAIYHEVAMLSYPFFNDQPELARRCERLGLSQPLVDAPQQRIDPVRARAAILRWESERHEFAARLADARAWELDVIAGRDEVVARVLALANAS